MFTFTAPASATAADWLKRSSAHLETLAVAEQRKWLADWTHYVKTHSHSKLMPEAGRDFIIVTLERWAEEIQLRLARAA